ncbi:MAG: GTPase ObgE [Deltaproteobacteria bacterium]|nr:GTPase ObgE [Deltaproteobacteria bacterium]
MKFIDEVQIDVKGGDGGRPCVAFLREKYRPYGGPAGGDGGNGGSVILEADPGITTLLDFRFRRRIEAERGEHGRGKSQHGRRGADAVARVPVGTLAYDARSGETLADLDRPGARAVVARGGRGGRGNANFATPTDQAPRKTIAETPGEERRLRLELRLIADVGIVGLPNAGKSTLVRAVSAARPKVADYPFTTLVPHLGVVSCGDDRSFVIADVPGLIPGAHRGEGLGDRFLRHLMRTRLLLHLVDLSGLRGRDPLEDLDAVNRELRQFDAGLAARPQIVVGNKIDLAEARAALARVAGELGRRGVELCAISAATGEGVRELVALLCARVGAGPPREALP